MTRDNSLMGMLGQTALKANATRKAEAVIGVSASFAQTALSARFNREESDP